MNEHDRRIHDMEIADLRVQNDNQSSQIKDLANQCMRLETQLTLLREDVKDLVEAWKSAKGVTSFVKWVAGLIVAAGIISLWLKGLKLP